MNYQHDREQSWRNHPRFPRHRGRVTLTPPQRNGMASATLEKDPAALLNRDDRSGKYLVFELGSEQFGIRVLQVREIMGVRDITALPQAPRPCERRDQPAWQGHPGSGPAPQVRPARSEERRVGKECRSRWSP